MLAWGLFREQKAPVTIESASERLGFDEPDFEPQEWFVDNHGRAVIAEGKGNDFALAMRVGADLITRRFARGAVRISAGQHELTVHPGDPGATRVTLEGEGADIWARKISG